MNPRIFPWNDQIAQKGTSQPPDLLIQALSITRKVDQFTNRLTPEIDFFIKLLFL